MSKSIFSSWHSFWYHVRLGPQNRSGNLRPCIIKIISRLGDRNKHKCLFPQKQNVKSAGPPVTIIGVVWKNTRPPTIQPAAPRSQNNAVNCGKCSNRAARPNGWNISIANAPTNNSRRKWKKDSIPLKRNEHSTNYLVEINFNRVLSICLISCKYTIE